MRKRSQKTVSVVLQRMVRGTNLCSTNGAVTVRGWKMADPRIMHVADEVRRLMRIFSDLCFDEAPQEEIDAAWRRYMYVKRLHREGVEYVPRF